MALKQEITNLPELVNKLKKKDRELFNRFYSIKLSVGMLKVTPEMENFVKNRFKSIEKTENQKIVCINNKFTWEGNLFNELRSMRPKPKTKFMPSELDNKENCLFCNIEKQTPLDIFGRIKGKHCITASNIAKYDKFHGLIIFKEHNPMKLKKTWLKDYLETAEKWFDQTDKSNKGMVNNFLIWNCLWRSSASIIHGHMQVTASETKYQKIIKLEEIYDQYKKKFKSDYFADLFKIHKNLGLGEKIGKSMVLYYLTPIKEKEIIILSKEKKFSEMGGLIYGLIENYFRIGVQSFNISITNIKGYWMVRLVDRGSLENRNSDIGAMELYGNSVVAYDPFRLAKEIKI
ncbi:MAG: hypothetical protein DRP06_00970 [Candidatus Aenigmatarchaeota archaeon]|nr:MAG: hypothetical protein DRP06_00970 [Candidatus Aenigmarchaeota archaeon]